jgi:Arc/MetJ-type ribon-helix-helix transcriptional regulator
VGEGMGMRIVTINIPDSYLTAFESLIKLGLYNSRSQMVREALKDFLDKEKEFTDELIVDNFEKIKSAQVKKP